MEKKPFTSVDAPIVVPSKITLQKMIGSPVSLSYTKPLKSAVCAVAKNKLKIAMKKKVPFLIILTFANVGI